MRKQRFEKKEHRNDREDMYSKIKSRSVDPVKIYSQRR